MFDKQAADLIEEKDLTERLLAERVIKLISNKKKLTLYKDNLDEFALKTSATKIYNLLRKMVDEDE